MNASNPNSHQVGGLHYNKAGVHQHWDMLPVFGYGWEYYIGRATAYLTRIKQPELDPKKAGHFVDKLIWLIDCALVPPVYRRNNDRSNLELRNYLATVYFPANGIQLRSRKASAISTLMFAHDRSDLVAAKQAINIIELAVEAGPEYVDQDNRMFVTGNSHDND